MLRVLYSPDISGVIKSRRLRLAWHVARVGAETCVRDSGGEA